ncbi:condensation domain-containing protein, partial [Actinoplanes philippinensis]|uniref:condensation domain-containing protein n=1 Tax=Actinoplanes philippinensis TaxID=35752 RepID=UPI0033CDE8E6
MTASTGGSVREWLAARRPAAIPRRSEPEPRASSAQQRMWFEDRYRTEIDPSLPGYASPHAVRMTGPLDVAALESAFGAVLARHETLRTTFTTRDGTLYQRINPPGPVDVRVDPVPDEAGLRTALAAAISEPLDLVRGPILRARLFRLSDTEHVLLVVVHHIATDGWSMDILFRELT